MDRSVFVEIENRNGSYYELAIELRARHDRASLSALLSALWRYSGLGGPWLVRENYGGSPVSLDSLDPYEDLQTLYGVLSVTGSSVVLGCLSVIVSDSAFWLDLCIPVGMLETAYTINYPLDKYANEWHLAVDNVLLDVADTVYAAVPFDLALIGEEASGFLRASRLASDQAARADAARTGGYLLSPELWERLAPAAPAIQRPSGLVWAPPRYWAREPG